MSCVSHAHRVHTPPPQLLRRALRALAPREVALCVCGCSTPADAALALADTAHGGGQWSVLVGRWTLRVVRPLCREILFGEFSVKINVCFGG